MNHEAEQLGIGFRLGLVEQSEVIAWADAKITMADEPGMDLIELAAMTKAHPQDVVGKLRSLSSERSAVEVLPEALGRFTSRLRERPELGPIVAKGLELIAIEANYDLPDDLDAIIGFYDEYALAQRGTFGTEADVYASLLAFCEGHEHAA